MDKYNLGYHFIPGIVSDFGNDSFLDSLDTETKAYVQEHAEKPYSKKEIERLANRLHQKTKEF